MNFYKKNIRKCWECDKYPLAMFQSIELTLIDGLKIIEKNIDKTSCRVGCCDLFYEGKAFQLRKIVNLWNSHTREIESRIKEHGEIIKS